uniref:Insulinase family protein n=1 Tax=Thermomicrobium roseum TaxID=500 RepID=A0A7C1JU60_THERO
MREGSAVVETRLENGLTVLVQPLRHAPVVSCWIWYRVGSRNEPPGLTGVSHWVEHMLFKGTPRFPPGSIFRQVNRWGGTLNGFTWLDYTAYFETLPTPGWELALEIEADRMVAASFDPAEVERERTVILSERAGSENQPGTYLREEVVAAAFRAHPYGHPVIGYREDLLHITRDELYQHYRTFYQPNNAVLVVVGDVEPVAALQAVERHFGGIPAGTMPPALRVTEPEQWGERRVTVRRPAPTAQLLMAWRVPAASHPDIPALLVLDAVLSGGKPVAFGGSGMGRSARLYRALVAPGLCTAAVSSMSLTLDPFLFTISATLTPLVEPRHVEQLVDDVVRRIREDPVSEEELARAKRQLAVQLAAANESAQSRAALLGSLAVVCPERSPEQLWREIEAVTSDDLLRVANTYLRPERRTVGWLEPSPEGEGSLGQASVVGARFIPLAEPETVAPRYWFREVPESSAEPVVLPRVQLAPTADYLANGAYFVGQEVSASRLAVVSVRIPAGAARDEKRPGLAYVTGQLLSRGTRRRDEASLNEELDRLGATLTVGVGRDAVDVSLSCLVEALDAALPLFAEVLLEPAFPSEQLESVRQQALTALRQAEQSTRARADALLRALIYPPGHPYHHRVLGTEETLETLSPEEVRAFHETFYRPAGAVVAVAGGVDLGRVRASLEQALASWQGEAPRLAIPTVEPSAQGQRRSETLPAKQQADVALGIVTVPRQHPDFEALRLANVVLGRLGLMGRIGARVRERSGLAYYAASTLETGVGPGYWSAYAGVAPVHVERVIAEIVEEIERFREEGPEARELADAKTALAGTIVLGLATTGGVAGALLDLAFYGLGLDYLERLPDLLAGIDETIVRDAALRYLDPQRLHIVVVGPSQETALSASEPQR